MSSKIPRCPNGILTKTACVTQKCNSSPYICQSINCVCSNAHQYCKKMSWMSVVSLLTNYQQNLADPIKAFIKRVDKIYNNIITKVYTEQKIFYQFLQEKLYGPQYSKIMHFLEKQNYNSITCNNLGAIITIMTDRICSKSSNQQGNISVEKFTLNQMKILDKQIQELMINVEGLYKQKYSLIEKQIRQLNTKQKRSQSSTSINISTQSFYHKNTGNNQSSKNFIVNKSNAFLQTYNNMPLSQSSVVLKRGESAEKNNFYGTTSTFFNTKADLFRKSQLASTNETKFYNPEVIVKIDLTYPKSINSKIVSNASALNHLILNKVSQYKLIYRASQNNFQISQFYRRIKNHTFHKEKSEKSQKIHNSDDQMTLLLVKTQFGKVIGGFTKVKWHRQNKNSQIEQQLQETANSKSNYKCDVKGTSIMFSVDLNQRYQLSQPQYAIYCGSKSIGFGNKDLRIVNHCQKHNKNYIGFPGSYNNGVYLPIKKSSLMISGSHSSSHLKICEWEMFEVILKDQKNISQQKLLELEKKKSTNSSKLK